MVEVAEKMKEVNAKLERRRDLRTVLALSHAKKSLTETETSTCLAWFGEIAGLIEHKEWVKIKEYSRPDLNDWINTKLQTLPSDLREEVGADDESISHLEQMIEGLDEEIALSLYDLSKEKATVMLKFDENGKKYEVGGKIEIVMMGTVRIIEDGKREANDYLVFYLTNIKQYKKKKNKKRIIGSLATGRKKDTSYRRSYQGDFPRGWGTDGTITKYDKKTRKYLIEGVNYIFNERGTYASQGNGEWYYRSQIEIIDKKE